MSAIAIDIHDFINTLHDEVRRFGLRVDTHDQDMHLAAEAGDVVELGRLVRVVRSSALRELSFEIEDTERYDPGRADALRQQAKMFGAAHA